MILIFTFANNIFLIVLLVVFFGATKLECFFVLLYVLKLDSENSKEFFNNKSDFK